MKTITKIEKIINAQKGHFFTVKFIKRTDGTERIMTCRTGVHLGLKDKGLKYNPLSKKLHIVFDIAKHDYRSIPLDTVLEINAGHKKYKFGGEL